MSGSQWVEMETRSGVTAPPGAAPAGAPGARPKSAASSSTHTPVVGDRTDRLEHIMKSVVDCQRRQQDQLDVEAQRHDQRWKAMEHQFHQLQSLVRGETARQSLVELQQDNPPISRPSSTQGLLPHVPDPQPHPGLVPAAGLQSSLNSSPISLATPPHFHPGWTNHKMSPYEEDEDIEHYLKTFERLAAASQWPLDTWALCLVPLLKGKARAAFVAMNIEDSHDYVKVKQAVLRKFEISYTHLPLTDLISLSNWISPKMVSVILGSSYHTGLCSSVICSCMSGFN